MMMPEWHQYLSLHKLLKCHNYTLFQRACHYTHESSIVDAEFGKLFFDDIYQHFDMTEVFWWNNIRSLTIFLIVKSMLVLMKYLWIIIHSQLARVKKGRWKVLKQCMKGPSRWKMKITWPSCQEKPKNHPSTRFKLFFWKRNDVLQIWITMWVYNLIRWAVFFHMHSFVCCNPLKPFRSTSKESKNQWYIFIHTKYILPRQRWSNTLKTHWDFCHSLMPVYHYLLLFEFLQYSYFIQPFLYIFLSPNEKFCFPLFILCTVLCLDSFVV